jgi:hypothetical protein
MLKVAVVDSGINPMHSHVETVVGGICFVSAELSLDPPWLDQIGHGTAVAAAIREKEARIGLWAVKIFNRSFSTQIDAVVQALEWCGNQGMDVVNLSAATAKPSHAEQLERVSHKPNILIAPYEFMGLPAYPGNFPWVFGVSPRPDCPRDTYQNASDGRTHFYASPLPRPIPGLPVAQNFSGPSFAVANFTGLVCRIMLENAIRSAYELRNFLAEMVPERDRVGRR